MIESLTCDATSPWHSPPCSIAGKRVPEWPFILKTTRLRTEWVWGKYERSSKIRELVTCPRHTVGLDMSATLQQVPVASRTLAHLSLEHGRGNMTASLWLTMAISSMGKHSAHSFPQISLPRRPK